MSLTLSCLLWSRPGQESALIDYEDRVLARTPRGEPDLISTGGRGTGGTWLTDNGILPARDDPG